MPKVEETSLEVDLSDPQYYFNRELSWLEFNRRVLNEALDSRTPLLERLKFIAIFSSNLDEFFMVRVSGLQEQVEAQVSELTLDGRTPRQQLDEIGQQLHSMVTQQHQLFEQELLPQMAAAGVHILNYSDIGQEQRFYLQRYFETRIFPVLTPLAVDSAHPFPYMSNLSLNLAVVVKDPKTEEENFARVKVPNSLPRFIPFPQELQHDGQPNIWTGVPLEQVIAHNMESLFPGMSIQGYSCFRVTRDADFALEQEGDDLLKAIQQELRQRRVGGSVVRIEIQASTPVSIRKTLMQQMQLTELDVYEVEGLLGLKDLMSFMSLPLPELKDPPWTAVIPRRLRWVNEPFNARSSLDVEEAKDIFCVIRQQDLLVHHPYESFTASVEHFISQAAQDPDVLAIKMTLYRTSGDSPIVRALISAAENGKQVAALVELKARFDEENNVIWANRLESSGVHVVYGIMGLKTHTKVVLVVRQEGEAIRRYVHIGTGNYNSKTANLYTDLGLFSCRDDLGTDLTDLFNYLTGYSKQQSYRKLLVAPVTLRDRMTALIQREIEHSKNGQPGRIIAKVNSLVDGKIIKTLYEASRSGVQIDLVVRGICCLRPGIKGLSDHIRVLSIIGRYLEHSRIFYFYNNAQEEIFIGSADWMTRNLDQRVEAVTPVEDPDIAKELKEILDIMLADNRQAWELQPDGSYIQRRPSNDNPEQSAQKILMERAQQGT